MKMEHAGEEVMKRPIGVMVLSILNFVGAGVFMLMAFGGFMGGSAFIAASAGMAGQFGWGIFVLIGIVCLVLASLALAIGIGFWKLLNWSRVLQIVMLFLFLGFQVFAVLGAMMHLAWGRVIFRVIVMSIEVWILSYLFRSHVKQAFRPVR